jgi:CheY-like chemotaxis protein
MIESSVTFPADFTVLIVEDDALIAIDSQDSLLEFGVPRVEIAATKEAAIRVLTAHPIHAAFLDLRLGNETSHEIADVMRARDIPFCYATGSSIQQEIPARNAAAQVLLKPYTADQLTGALRTMLGA